LQGMIANGAFAVMTVSLWMHTLIHWSIQEMVSKIELKIVGHATNCEVKSVWQVACILMSSVIDGHGA